ncbi:hypothetical protein LRR81_05465 [Metabacillus sp. GX 13764]|uniref:hypothetical protein n=1 Tax=Metabacillus kandeliae TaxID=2900151 RepID=UPI001E5D949F|nr:hypothetical protein [Metabacillus kandeliae]MCD7033673.1 hypothetical protein [Metabacillus kandeliae]
MKRPLSTHPVFTSLLLLFLYTAFHSIGETKAAYSSQNDQVMAVTAAVVFPSTIHKLRDEASKNADAIQSLTQTHLELLSAGDLLALRKGLIFETEHLQTIQQEINSYERKTEDSKRKEEYRFVIEGSAVLNKLVDKSKAPSFLSRLNLALIDTQQQGKEKAQGKHPDPTKKLENAAENKP